MLNPHDIFEGLKTGGYSYVFILVIICLLGYFLKREWSSFFEQAKDHHKTVLKIHESNVDVDTKSIIRRSDLKEDLEEVSRKLDDVHFVCSGSSCPFHDNFIEKLEEVAWNSERLEKIVELWKEGADKTQVQMTENMGQVNHELLALIRAFIDGLPDRKARVSERSGKEND